MKIFPESTGKYKYQALWQKVIRTVMVNQKIIRMMKNFASPDTEEIDILIRRSSALIKTQDSFSVPFGVILPFYRAKEVWDLYIAFVLIYTALVTPFTISFLDLAPGDFISNFDIVIDITFVIDLILNVNTAFVNEDNVLVVDRGMILKNYLRHGLLIDLISSFPFSLFDITTRGFSTLFRIFRLRALSRLLKLSRLFKVVTKKEHSIAKYLQNFFCISHTLIRIIKFLAMLTLSVHLAACIWHWTARSQDYDPSTWVYNTGNVDTALYRKYIISLYWALVTLATIGYGEIRPFSRSEQIFSIFWMVFALYFLSFSISSLSSMLSQIDIRKNLLRQKMTFVDDFSKEVKLSKRLKKELQKILIHNIDRFNYSYEDRINLVSEFPNDLRLEIANTMQKGMAVRFDLFSREDDNLIQEVIPLMQNLSIPGSQILYSLGESSTKIYFLIRGRVHFLLKNEKTVFQIFSDKGYFGDIEVIFGIHRLNTAITANECRLMILGVDIIKKIQKNFPQFYNKMKEAAKTRLSISRKTKAEMKALLKVNKTDALGRRNSLDEVREKVRRKTLTVDFSKIITTNKVLQKAMARESLKLTTEYLDECREDLAKAKELFEQLKVSISGKVNL